MPPQQRERGININTVLMTILMTISGWTLKEVIALGKSQAAVAVEVDNLKRVVYTTKYNSAPHP